ncbi:malate dehydrogenase [Plasmodiophora brassicae]|uniref:Malate dehydrogenase n=1 Tax=Plasmodiophora brassicae TaxID=37360 RepID=A0A0G4IV36_PLABS|nr:hypothetical protein PBRA_001030 [Plasmodiophora brassicae]SPQ97143.1 unnamed protein product [Plasmodiophora brassicae]
MATARAQRLLSQCETAAAGPAPKKKPVNVVVTGAAGNIAYSIVFHIGAGLMLGDDQPINLILLDIPGMEKKMEGVAMELRDCAFPLLTKIVSTTDYKTAFTDCHIALLIGARPRGPGMQRADLLSANAKIFAGQGKALDQYANKNVKVLVVGNPANTNALLTALNAPSIPKQNITALTRLDQNRAIAQVAGKLNVPVGTLSGCIIWGNHSKTQYPDINHGSVIGIGGSRTPLPKAVADKKWVQNEFLTTVQDRGAAIIQARGLSSAASAGIAAVNHIRDWVKGTAPGQIVSMAVYSDGKHYNIPKDIVYSFPVTCKNGTWTIVDGLKIDEFSRKKMDLSAAELLEEKQLALAME